MDAGREVEWEGDARERLRTFPEEVRWLFGLNEPDRRSLSRRNGPLPLEAGADMSEKKGSGFVRGSGNVFADVGLPDAEDTLAKARLAEAIAEAIERRDLTQTETAAILGVDQPKISKIVNGRLEGFTQDRLMRSGAAGRSRST